MSGNFEFYPVIQHNLILSTSQMEKLNFIQLSDPKLNFISLSRKSAVGQNTDMNTKTNWIHIGIGIGIPLGFLFFIAVSPHMGTCA